jgi:hypothetical protein
MRLSFVSNKKTLFQGYYNYVNYFYDLKARYAGRNKPPKGKKINSPTHAGLLHFSDRAINNKANSKRLTIGIKSIIAHQSGFCI